MISVLYISNRYGGLDILRGNLARQTEQDFELVFVDGLYHERKDEVKEYFKDFKVKHIDESIIDKAGQYSTLARADNLGYKNCEGDLIVCLQDYIYIPHDGFEKFVFINQIQNGNALITGVGHQYLSPSSKDIVNPKGLITVFESEYTKKPENKFWQDPRENGFKGVRPAEAVEWELNWACISKKAILDLGGMDEEYDKKGFGWDNTCIAERAKILGYSILLDASNECYGFNHDGWWPNPLKINRISPAEYHFKQIGKMKTGEISARLNYLS
jgi:hypothetical protein